MRYYKNKNNDLVEMTKKGKIYMVKEYGVIGLYDKDYFKRNYRRLSALEEFEMLSESIDKFNETIIKTFKIVEFFKFLDKLLSKFKKSKGDNNGI